MMGTKLLFGMVLFSACLCASRAFALKPTVRAVRVKDKVVYEFVPESETMCDKGGTSHFIGLQKASGCTVRRLEYKINVNCKKKEIYFSFGIPIYKVELVNTLKKGTRDFDMVLKHESTHVQIGRRTIEKFYPSVAQALLMQYERSEQNGKNCFEIRRDIYMLFYEYMELLQREQKKHDDMIDGAENYAYQWGQAKLLDLKDILGLSQKEKQEKQASRPPQNLPSQKQKKETPVRIAEKRTPPPVKEPVRQYALNERPAPEPVREKIIASPEEAGNTNGDLEQTSHSSAVFSERAPEAQKEEIASLPPEPSPSGRPETDKTDIPEKIKERPSTTVLYAIKGLLKEIEEKSGLKEKIEKLLSYIKEGLHLNFSSSLPEKMRKENPSPEVK